MSEETIPQMRDQIDSQAKQIKTLEGTNAELGKDLRTRDAREAFRDAGYNPKHGDLYADKNPSGDITQELVASFAGDWDLSPLSDDSDSSDEGDGTTDAGDGSDALSSMDRSGSRAGDGGDGVSNQKLLTRQEWAEMKVSDPAQAAAALNQGRVLVSTSGNLRVGQTQAPGVNPYEPTLAEA
jgi:hypothetical protein